MGLNEKPEIRILPAVHYVFIEKTGPFQQTAPAAWSEFHQKIGTLIQDCGLVSITSLYKIAPKMIYRAGAMVGTEPKDLPAGFSYEKFRGGKYACFTYTGPYSNLPVVVGKAFEIAKQIQLSIRDDYYVENYPNDPKVTPEDQLITEIMMPTN